jgi:hypothetical protein
MGRIVARGLRSEQPRSAVLRRKDSSGVPRPLCDGYAQKYAHYLSHSCSSIQAKTEDRRTPAFVVEYAEVLTDNNREGRGDDAGHTARREES